MIQLYCYQIDRFDTDNLLQLLCAIFVINSRHVHLV